MNRTHAEVFRHHVQLIRSLAEVAMDHAYAWPEAKQELQDTADGMTGILEQIEEDMVGAPTE